MHPPCQLDFLSFNQMRRLKCPEIVHIHTQFTQRLVFDVFFM
jgi:hypothetical protein